MTAANPAHDRKVVCTTDQLTEAGAGVRFEVTHPLNGALPAFVVRVEGQAKGYLNRCSHVPVELDWPTNQFLDESGLYIVCATHGAMYLAEDGQCAGGPCNGRGLIGLDITEQDGVIWCRSEIAD